MNHETLPKLDDYVALTRDARCEFAGWQQRYLCPDEGPGDWHPCTERDAQILVKRTDYELRPVYAFRILASDDVPPNIQNIPSNV